MLWTMVYCDTGYDTRGDIRGGTEFILDFQLVLYRIRHTLNILFYNKSVTIQPYCFWFLVDAQMSACAQ